MKKIKYIIILLLIIIISLFVSIFYMMNKNNTTSGQIKNTQQEEKEKNEVEKVTNSIMYFTVESCIDKYIGYVSRQDKAAIYGVLDASYIEENKIEQNNVLNYVTNITNNDVNFDIQQMLVSGDGENLQTYYVCGMLREQNKEKKLCLTVNIDIENMVFSIIPYTEEGVFDGK